LRGEQSLAEAVQQIKHQTHRFVRHQYAWFRPADPRITWFDVSRQTVSTMVETVSRPGQVSAEGLAIDGDDFGGPNELATCPTPSNRWPRVPER
jgi:hypothetical protein